MASQPTHKFATRHQQRQCILECLYMWDVQKDIAIERLYSSYCKEKTDIAPEVLNGTFVLETLRGVVTHYEQIDQLIAQEAEHWEFSRISKIDLAILRLAIYEMQFAQKAPKPVVINEAIELSKAYASDDSKRFINGILDHIAKASQIPQNVC